MFIAKPNLNNSLGAKEFPTKEQAVAYLESVTGFQMGKEKNRKTGEVVYDWEIIGKLFSKNG